jgi:hypothetical protein
MSGKDWLSVFVITYGTVDFGNLYVVREWRTYPPAHTSALKGFVYSPESRMYMAIEPCAVATALEHARAMLEHRGLYRLPRDERDDPTVVESWL